MTRVSWLRHLAAVLLAIAAARAEGAETDAPPRGVLCLRKLPPPGQFATEGKGSSDFSDEDTTDRRGAQRRSAGSSLSVLR